MSRSLLFRRRDVQRMRRLFLEPLEDRSLLATIIVTGTGDAIAVDGLVTLREAITAANTNAAAGDAPAGDAGLDTINFNIPGAGVQTISPVTVLPTITDSVIIDGYTQPGASANTNGTNLGLNSVLLIELSGASAPAGSNFNGLTINADGCTIRGLVINSFEHDAIGINSDGNVIEGNFIGTNVAGTAALPNASTGVGAVIVGFGVGRDTNTIGGLTPAARNLISGNIGVGVLVRGRSNLVQGNLIGTDVTGSQALGNSGVGVTVESDPDKPGAGNTVGGTTATARNIISANNRGVSLRGIGHAVQGNYVGTNITGTAALPNPNEGVHLDTTIGVQIGGITPTPGTAPGNLISGNGGAGIDLFTNVNTTLIQGNIVGADITGTNPLGNSLDGILITSTGDTPSSNNTIGGTAAGAANIIAFNGTDISAVGKGVHIGSSTFPNVGNAILGNSIFSNDGLGIDLRTPNDGTGGPTPNDTGDTDTGANHLQNYPELLVRNVNGTINVGVSLNSIPNTKFRIEVFVSAAADPSGFGEGQTLYFVSDLTTDANGNGGFVGGASPPVSGSVFTATATRLDAADTPIETSEFSGAFVAPQDCSLIVTNTNDSGPGSLRQAILCANFFVDPLGAADTITFDIPGAGVHTISPMSPLPTITDPVVIDGYSQPGAIENSSQTGWNGTLQVELNGANAGSAANGLHVTAGNSLVKGLVINRFSLDGIFLQTTGSNQVSGNFIGTSADGTLAVGNENGIDIESTQNLIGGQLPASRNVVSGNHLDGIQIDGGTGANFIENNFIGTTASGAAALGNLDDGIDAAGVTLNTIGGVAADARNVIAFNNDDGVVIASGTTNRILGNSIFSNGGQGIDLGGDGPTPNDALDADTGANNLQNFPVLTTVTQNATTTTIQGALNSLANTSFRIEFFANAIADPSGFGEGQNFIGFTTVTTNGSGDATFNFNELTQPGTVFTATATRLDANLLPIETSEFSGSRVVQASEADLAVTKVGAASVIAGQNITYTITVANNGPVDAQNVVLTDTVPANTNFAGFLNISQGAASQIGGQITANFGTVTVGTPATLTFVVTASASAADGTVITNTAAATSDTSDPTPGNNTGTANTTVLNAADLVVTKSGPSNVLPGEDITYTLTVTNNGPITAQNVVLTDTVPANTTFAGFLGISQGSATQMGGLITANFGTVAIGTPATLTFVVTTDASAPNGTVVTNTATVTSDTFDPNTANNIGTATTDVGALGLADCEVVTLNVPGALGTATLEDDADNPGSGVLIVTGTTGNDVIVVEPNPRNRSQLRVLRNGRVIGTFNSSDTQRIVALGLAGNDKIIINSAILKPATLFGDAGNDYLFGAKGADGLEGGSGVDRLFGGSGDDTLCGGDGNDFVYGQAGNDFAGGEAGNDRVFGEAGNDFLLGNEGNDFLYGGIGNDRMFGQAGNDQLFGEAGNDIGVGGDGNDRLFGGSGRDVLIGGDGLDTLFGEAHDDILVAGPTVHDEDDEALQAILAEWTSANSYTTRVNNIRNGGGANGAFVLDDTTVIDDGLADTLWGNGGLDWFLFGDGDKLKDMARSELVN